MISEVRLQDWLPDANWAIDEAEFRVLEVSDDPASARRVLAMVLQMAIADRAESVHYLPLQPRSGTHAILSYVVHCQTYTLVDPPEFIANHMFAQARQLLTPNRVQRFLDRLFGRSAIGRFRVVRESTATEWFGACWARGDLCGLDFYRVLPEGVAPPPVHAGEEVPTVEPAANSG
jgi:hypothetical protein